LAPTPERLPLPAPVALAILKRAEQLLRGVQWGALMTNDIMLLRACLASIASYIFFSRGECNASTKRGDLVVDSTHITLRLGKEKGQHARQEGRKNTRQILREDMPRVANALASFFKGVESMGKPRAHRWALNNDEDRCEWTANESTRWLQAAYKAVGHYPPPGFSWTSHSLRKGAASAANAIKIALNDIRYAGGWSTNSTVLEAKYIDFAMAPSEAAHVFFGHMKRDTPQDEIRLRQSSGPDCSEPRQKPSDPHAPGAPQRKQRLQSQRHPPKR
jgi:hypothetical protein